MLGIALQVGALALLARALRIENPAFYGRLMPLIAVAFVAHHALAPRWRLEAFALLSVASLFLVFGLDGGPWLVGIGLVVIAICHLPLGYWWRVCLLLATGALLAVMRAGAWNTPWPAAVWPILGSMFMYRLIANTYDLRHRSEVGAVRGIGESSFAAVARLTPVPAASTDRGRLALAETGRSKLFWGLGPARKGVMHSLFDDTWHYIRDGEGREELFAYRTDTAEAANLATADTARTALFHSLLSRVTTRLVW